MRVAVFIADREFGGQEGGTFLRWKGTRQCLRIRENTRIEDEVARELFTTLQPGEVRTLFERTWVYGEWMHVVIPLSPAGDKGIVASDSPVPDVLEVHRRRRGIESAFSSLKGRGLNLEATHMTAPDRNARLSGLLCVALVWMARVGTQTMQYNPPRQDNRGRGQPRAHRVAGPGSGRAMEWEVFWVCLGLLSTPFPPTGTSISRSIRC